MDLSRREALRLGLTGAGGLLLPWGLVERALADEPCPKDSACTSQRMGEGRGQKNATAVFALHGIAYNLIHLGNLFRPMEAVA